jgi:hypothetical protein
MGIIEDTKEKLMAKTKKQETDLTYKEERFMKIFELFPDTINHGCMLRIDQMYEGKAKYFKDDIHNVEKDEIIRSLIEKGYIKDADPEFGYFLTEKGKNYFNR